VPIDEFGKKARLGISLLKSRKKTAKMQQRMSIAGEG
jgi:hypothetical protein